MLSVKTPNEVMEIICKNFGHIVGDEYAELTNALGRVLSEDVISTEYVPGFNRSSVDGYAVLASDTFGCSESIPAILRMMGYVQMGQSAELALSTGFCIDVPTGGEVAQGADSVVMVEYTEDYRDGTIGVLKPTSPGNNIIFKGDDVKPGGIVLRVGKTITSHDIGALAALGTTSVKVRKKPTIGIISTGDELIDAGLTPKGGQIRDVNTYLLSAAVTSSGGEAKTYGIINDEDEALEAAFDKALQECDMVLISGGSSVGLKDATARIIQGRGEILLHGIAMKPGKPTILGKAKGKPVFGLPGHPVAAYIVTQIFVVQVIDILTGRNSVAANAVCAQITEEVSSNHGRAEYIAVRLRQSDGVMYAEPVRGKSGLITGLTGTDGYICIPRDKEGVRRGADVNVTLWRV